MPREEVRIGYTPRVRAGGGGVVVVVVMNMNGKKKTFCRATASLAFIHARVTRVEATVIFVRRGDDDMKNKVR